MKVYFGTLPSSFSSSFLSAIPLHTIHVKHIFYQFTSRLESQLASSETTWIATMVFQQLVGWSHFEFLQFHLKQLKY
jgi:hypothetical protein